MKTKKFTDGRVGNKFSRIAKVAKPNDNGKIKVTRIRCFKIRLRLFLKLKRGTESKEEGPRFYFGKNFPAIKKEAHIFLLIIPKVLNLPNGQKR
ncbi:hypothetical protein [Pedobacter sp. Leaf216]|uniref:hypothetical protein n=1 Tax=Pedobacter sp. Leaf216 TaxID=1735684 RepID=UPI0012FA4645|nr:hypothetical protein [Pedobacter sp. Leaf216]